MENSAQTKIKVIVVCPHLGKGESYAEGSYYNLSKTYLHNADKMYESSQPEENKQNKYLQHRCREKNREKVSVREQSGDICGCLFARQSLRLGTKVEKPSQITSKPSFFPIKALQQPTEYSLGTIGLRAEEQKLSRSAMQATA